MQGYDLIKDMGSIDDELVAGALQGKALRGWRAPSRWLAAAACVAVAALVGWGVWKGAKPQVDVPADETIEAPVTEESEAEVQLTEEQTDIEVEAPQTEPSPEPGVNEEPISNTVAESVVVSNPEIEPEPVSNPNENDPISESSAAFSPVLTTDPDESFVTTPMIESYDGDYPEACYDYAVDNGTVGYSQPLMDAMAEYGDTVLYRVYADIFKNGVQLAASDPEVMEQLSSLLEQGIISAYESVYQDGNFVVAYPTLHATYDQLQNFKADSGHGWMLFLYAEKV